MILPSTNNIGYVTYCKYFIDCRIASDFDCNVQRYDIIILASRLVRCFLPILTLERQMMNEKLKEHLLMRIDKGVQELNVPFHNVDSIKYYITEGIAPGGFLQAVISNDLREAVGSADHMNIVALPNLVRFFYNYAPGVCWGSEEKFHEYLVSFTETSDHQ